MFIPSDTRIFRSELGAKGFFYPSHGGFTSLESLEIERAPIVFSEEYGLIPITILDKDSSIYWIERRVFDVAEQTVERFPGVERL